MLSIDDFKCTYMNTNNRTQTSLKGRKTRFGKSLVKKPEYFYEPLTRLKLCTYEYYIT